MTSADLVRQVKDFEIRIKSCEDALRCAMCEEGKAQNLLAQVQREEAQSLALEERARSVNSDLKRRASLLESRVPSLREGVQRARSACVAQEKAAALSSFYVAELTSRASIVEQRVSDAGRAEHEKAQAAAELNIEEERTRELVERARLSEEDRQTVVRNAAALRVEAETIAELRREVERSLEREQAARLARSRATANALRATKLKIRESTLRAATLAQESEKVIAELRRARNSQDAN